MGNNMFNPTDSEIRDEAFRRLFRKGTSIDDLTEDEHAMWEREVQDIKRDIIARLDL